MSGHPNSQGREQQMLWECLTTWMLVGEGSLASSLFGGYAKAGFDTSSKKLGMHFALV